MVLTRLLSAETPPGAIWNGPADTVGGLASSQVNEAARSPCCLATCAGSSEVNRLFQSANGWSGLKVTVTVLPLSLPTTESTWLYPVVLAASMFGLPAFCVCHR